MLSAASLHNNAQKEHSKHNDSKYGLISMTYFVKLPFPQATNVTCTKLKTKFDSYSSFRIMLNGINFKDSLNPESWPSGVLIIRFYSPALSKNQSGSSANSDNAEKLNNT